VLVLSQPDPTRPVTHSAADVLRPHRADLWIEGNTIAAVSPPDPAPAWPEDEVETRDAAEFWILPGFVQAHVHLCQTLFRGAGEGLSLYRWLSEVIWPMEAALEPDTIEVAADLALRQLLSGGSTTILDMGTTRHTGAVLSAVARAGIRALSGPALMDRGPEAAGGLIRKGSESMAEIEDLAAQWHGYDDNRIRIALCPRFVPSVSGGLWKEMLARSDFASFPVHTHCAETEEEVADVLSLTGRSPAAYLSSLEGAQGRLKLAHAIWLSREDRADMARAAAAILHCPGSNLKLGSGLADVRALREVGLPVGLGADGAACNNRLDAWQEMRLAGYIQSLLRGPDAVEPAEILRLATVEGAKALGLEEEIGTLRAGKRADFLLLDPRADDAALGAADEVPGSDPAGRAETPEAMLVFTGSPAMVSETWIDGVCRYAKRDDGEGRGELIRRVRWARERLAGRLNR
jgi:5-methylthioadenosine/S-adenosylhomocysteine deaminase